MVALESEADLLDLLEDNSTGLSVGKDVTGLTVTVGKGNGENVIGRPVGLGSGRKIKRDRYAWWLGIDKLDVKA